MAFTIRNVYIPDMKTAFAILLLIMCSQSSLALDWVSFTKDGFTSIPLVTPTNIKESFLNAKDKKDAIRHYCETVNTYFKKYNWNEDACGKSDWRADIKSSNGHPLIYKEFGSGDDTTLFLGGVHPDELTPIPIAFRLAKHLEEHNELYKNTNTRIIVAPLVNPDGFLRNVASRNNSNGVDLNRNFFTFDWYEKAKKVWIGRRQRNPRHFPGYFPNSEIETMFQIYLIDKFQPDKIISIHAPLGFLDYDGPGDGSPRALSGTEKKAKQLVHSISEKSKNYRVVDYSFYPGSLGNYAGNERNIPTVTLELETTRPEKVDEYWNQFLPGLQQSISYPFKNDPLTSKKQASRFSLRYFPEQ